MGKNAGETLTNLCGAGSRMPYAIPVWLLALVYLSQTTTMVVWVEEELSGWNDGGGGSEGRFSKQRCPNVN